MCIRDRLTSSYGWALVLFTVVIKLIMLPFQMKSKKSMMRMSRFQPMIKEIQTRYKNNQVKMNEELQRLYAEEGVNPMSGCQMCIRDRQCTWQCRRR